MEKGLKLDSFSFHSKFKISCRLNIKLNLTISSFYIFRIYILSETDYKEINFAIANSFESVDFRRISSIFKSLQET